MKIKIPFSISLTGCTESDGNTCWFDNELDYAPEPFHTRESLEATLRRKVLDHLMRSATVEIDEKALDKALNVCNSVVESLERTALDEDVNDMAAATTPPATFEEYENERLNYGDEDEDDDWLNRHNGLCHIASDRDEEYDTEALIKTVLAYEYYQ